jgi:recombination associated protein RdgC
MYFRNLTFFRFPAAVAEAIREAAARDPRHDAQATREQYSLQALLSELAAKPCGPMEMSSRGWVSPFGVDAEAMFQQVGDCLLLTLGGEDKILPGSAVNAAVHKRIAEIEQREGRKISGRARKALRDEIVHDLLPRALVKPFRLTGYLDLQECFLAVDTGSRKAGEGFVSHLRHTLGSFPGLPLNAEAPPRAVLTGWISGDEMPTANDDGSPGTPALRLDDSATLQDPTDDGGVVKLDRLALGADEIRHHLETGMQCTRLGLTLDDRLAFTLDEDLGVRKLKFLDAALESLDAGDRDDFRAELDARFVLMSGEVRALFRTLAVPLKFSTAEG